MMTIDRVEAAKGRPTNELPIWGGWWLSAAKPQDPDNWGHRCTMPQPPITETG